jgi:selenocysteine-specific elongation factor
MRTFRFEASLTLGKKEGALPAQAVLRIQGLKVPASFQAYETAAQAETSPLFVRVLTHRPLSLKWRDAFDILDAEKMESIGQGMVLNPFLPEKGKFKKETRINFLRALSGSAADMLAGLCREKGMKGLGEEEVREFSSLGEEQILSLGEKLEEEGKIKIISFSPLFFVSRESFDFLGDKILAFLEQIRQKHPGQRGVALERIRKRFELAQKVLALAVKTLEKTGKVVQVGQRLALHSQEVSLSPHEEQILQNLEEMCLQGEFQSVSLPEIQRRFRLSPERLERLLSLLVEREKIIPGPEGLYIHSRWLDEIISQVRALGKKEMTVQDFKAITGLSRKYAIPLLELLDQMEVTRRKGPVRKIL